MANQWEAYQAQRRVCDQTQAEMNCAARLWVKMPEHAAFVEELRRATIAQDEAFTRLVGMPLDTLRAPVKP